MFKTRQYRIRKFKEVLGMIATGLLFALFVIAMFALA